MIVSFLAIFLKRPVASAIMPHCMTPRCMANLRPAVLRADLFGGD